MPKPRAAKKPFLTWHRRPDDRRHGGGGTEKAGGSVGAPGGPTAARPLRSQHAGLCPPLHPQEGGPRYRAGEGLFSVGDDAVDVLVSLGP